MILWRFELVSVPANKKIHICMHSYIITKLSRFGSVLRMVNKVWFRTSLLSSLVWESHQKFFPQLYQVLSRSSQTPKVINPSVMITSQGTTSLFRNWSISSDQTRYLLHVHSFIYFHVKAKQKQVNIIYRMHKSYCILSVGIINTHNTLLWINP